MELNKLKVNPKNPRVINQDSLARLKDKINEFPKFLKLRPIVYDPATMYVLGGNQRLTALRELGYKEIPDEWVKSADDLTEEEKQAFIVIDNISDGSWEQEMLSENWDEQDLEDWGLDISEFETEEQKLEAKEDDYQIPDQIKTDIVKGDLFEFKKGKLCHRLLCGDSTNVDDVEKLMDGRTFTLLHSDPPYGMGKQKDGVINDNLYNEKLDSFQMAWISAYLQKSTERCSIYIWGNPEPLWRLWFGGGLCEIEGLTLKNQIVWDKKNIPGMASPLLTMYPVVSEHCLFIQKGKQWRGNVNTDDYWEGYEVVRKYLANAANQESIKASDIVSLCGVGMYSHWFTKSQWSLIPENHYGTLQSHYPSFDKPWSDIKKQTDSARRGLNQHISSERPYFDNSHDAMTDVWDFKRVVGEDRHGHATPKPLDLMFRVIKSSSDEYSIVSEPFLGSGSTMIASHQLKRNCYGMELGENWCQVIVNRMLKLDNEIQLFRNGKDVTKKYRERLEELN